MSALDNRPWARMEFRHNVIADKHGNPVLGVYDPNEDDKEIYNAANLGNTVGELLALVNGEAVEIDNELKMTPEEFPVGSRFVREYDGETYEVEVLEWSSALKCVKVLSNRSGPTSGIGEPYITWEIAGNYRPNCVDRLKR